MKTILITGSSGFIGKNAVKYFKKKGYRVKTADIKKGKDLRNLKTCIRATKNVDWVIHLAADNGGYFYLNGDNFNEMNNYLMDISMIYASNLNKVKHFFFASSSCVYPTDKPQNYYGATKLLIEKLLKKSGLNYSIARLQNVFGEYETIYGEKEKVIPSFIRQINKGNVDVFGGGNQERSFIYVKDVCEIIENMINKKTKLKDVGGEILTLKELLNILVKISKRKVKIKYGKKIKDRFNCFPKSSSKTDLIKALRRTYKWTTRSL